jgi:glycosyltransferase involved in cell wall biosynthesis
MTPLLSICIATLASREEKFNALRTKLLKQCCDLEHRSVIHGECVWTIGSGQDAGFVPFVEILYDKDAGGPEGKPVGAKRQDMLERATGKFICYIDDDDDVVKDYVESITDAILTPPTASIDCIGFDIDCYGYASDPHKLEKARVSNRYQEWANDVDGFRYVRCPHHLMPIRRDLALLAGFPRDLKLREDSAYSFKLRDLGVLKNEVFVEKVLYTIWHTKGKAPGQ